MPADNQKNFVDMNFNVMTLLGTVVLQEEMAADIHILVHLNKRLSNVVLQDLIRPDIL